MFRSALLRPSSLCAGLQSLASPRWFSTTADRLARVRNIGISAHIDSGKTTLTERVLFYSGRIHEIHEVRGKDKVGATMDHMELEREKGITIQSAATHTQWNGHHINLIDTPGHVDFTIEVERSLRVLDGAVLVLCGVASVQSQSMTVDKQMRRYNVPRLTFINKMDRMGANPFKCCDDVNKVLRQRAAVVQVPIGSESAFSGVVDVLTGKASYFDGSNGEVVRVEDCPADLVNIVAEKKRTLIEAVADIDDEIAEIFLAEEEPTVEQMKAAIRRQTVALQFSPVLMGSAIRNKGIQPLLDAVVDYLPNPAEVDNYALDLNKNEEKVKMIPEDSKPLVALAFKLEEGKYGQLTYMRVYQGLLKRAMYIFDTRTKQKFKLQRLVRMHSNNMEDITEAGAGEIVAMHGVDCASGTTFTAGDLNYAMTSMHVPDPVISLAVAPKISGSTGNFSKALNRFQKEDPTFRLHTDPESQETIISGMGELHLEIYIERMKREYNVDTIVGNPRVNYRETLTKRADFSYTHKKQSGGSGQYGKVIGYIEPLPADSKEVFVFDNQLSGNNIPPEFHAAIEKGFREAIVKGALSGHPVVGIRVVLLDGQSHPVDSNEIAFRLAALYAFREAFMKGGGIVLEPIMSVEVDIPSKFQAGVVAGLNRRRGLILSVEAREGDFAVVRAEAPLVQMFGYSTDLRSGTEGKGEFTMEYKEHQPTLRDDQEKIMAEWQKRRMEKEK